MYKCDIIEYIAAAGTSERLPETAVKGLITCVFWG